MSLGRKITHHHVGVKELDSAYEITALDNPSPLSKCYRVNALDSVPGHQSINTFNIQFQDDDPKILGHNGLTDEVLLAILIDRAEHQEQRLPHNITTLDRLQQVMHSMKYAILEHHDAKGNQRKET